MVVILLMVPALPAPPAPDEPPIEAPSHHSITLMEALQKVAVMEERQHHQIEAIHRLEKAVEALSDNQSRFMNGLVALLVPALAFVLWERIRRK